VGGERGPEGQGGAGRNGGEKGVRLQFIQRYWTGAAEKSWGGGEEKERFKELAARPMFD